MADLSSIIRKKRVGHWERGSAMTSTGENEIDSGLFTSFLFFFLFFFFLHVLSLAFKAEVNTNLS